MAANPTLAAELRATYTKEIARLKDDFVATRDGAALVAGRTVLVDSIAKRSVD